MPKTGRGSAWNAKWQEQTPFRVTLARLARHDDATLVREPELHFARDVEKRANAFAAMLLMPTDRVRRLIRDTNQPPASRELVIGVAKQLNTSFRTTLEHLRNLGFIADEDRDAPLDEQVDRAFESS